MYLVTPLCIDPFQHGEGTVFNLLAQFMKIALFFLHISLLLALGALNLKRIVLVSSVAPPRCGSLAPSGLKPVVSPSEDLTRKLADPGSQESKLDWQKWTYKSVPVFVVLLTVSTLIGARTVLLLVLSVAILMALIINGVMKETLWPMPGNDFKQVASDGLRVLGDKVEGGLLGLGSRLGGGFVVGMLVLGYFMNNSNRITGNMNSLPKSEESNSLMRNKKCEIVRNN